MRVSWSVVALMLGCCTVTGLSAARRVVGPDSASIERGRILFEQHCASCHGKEGRGDGPTAATLTRRPPNLSALQQRSGAFFTAAVESAITGTNPAVAHRAPGMIVWSAIFRADARGNRAAADARLHDLVAFIESIQQK